MIDKKLTFCEDLAVTVSAGSDILDLGEGHDAFGNDVYPNLEHGSPKFLNILCSEGVTADGAATVAFSLRTDTDSAMGSPTTLLSTSAIGKASLTAGAQVFKSALPAGSERYLDVFFTVATGPLTAGKFTAFISTE